MLEVSRSGYYKWVMDGCPVRRDRDIVLLAVIRKVERDNGGNYGVRRVHRSINDEHGILCSRGKIQRIMHQNGIRAQRKSNYKPQTTKADPAEKAFENILGQRFEAEESNQVWLSDITYIRVNGKWAYLSAVMDLWHRKIVGLVIRDKPQRRSGLQGFKESNC